jgi:hypothetical protein
MKPSTFLNFGKAYAGVPEGLAGYVYFYGQKRGEMTEIFLGRAASEKMLDRGAYEFWAGLGNDQPRWAADPAKARPVFTDRSGDLASVVYLPSLRRYLLSAFHLGPGQLGVFDAPNPWGLWTTVTYEQHWAGMGTEGQGLTCSFPSKWVSPDGSTVWCVFSAYGPGANEGIKAHDKFNLVKARVELKP